MKRTRVAYLMHPEVAAAIRAVGLVPRGRRLWPPRVARDAAWRATQGSRAFLLPEEHDVVMRVANELGFADAFGLEFPDGRVVIR